MILMNIHFKKFWGLLYLLIICIKNYTLIYSEDDIVLHISE